MSRESCRECHCHCQCESHVTFTIPDMQSVTKPSKFQEMESPRIVQDQTLQDVTSLSLKKISGSKIYLYPLFICPLVSSLPLTIVMCIYHYFRGKLRVFVSTVTPVLSRASMWFG